MKDKNKTKEQLINELAEIRQRITKSETAEIERKLIEEQAKTTAIIDAMIDGVIIADMQGKITNINRAISRQLGYGKEETIGKTQGELFLAEKDRSAFSATLKQLLSGKPTGTSEYLVKRKNGTEFPAIINLSILRDIEDRPSQVVTVLRDTTKSKQTEHALNERVKELQCFYGIARIAEKPAITLDELCQQVVNLLPMAWQYPEITCARIIVGNKRFETENWRETVWKQSSAIKVRQAQTGTIDVCYLSKKAFLRQEGLLLDAIAERVGKIIERRQAESARVEQVAALARAKELQQSRQRIVLMEESLRKEIAQQLHGTVQNKLIVLLHRVTELEQRATSQEKVAAELGNLRQALKSLLERDVIPISRRLYPSILRRGITTALQSLGDQFETAMSIEMKLDEELVRQERAARELIPEKIRLAVYRTSEEALTNAVKHGKATRITIGLEQSSDGWLHLTVQDNGQGFDTESASDGLGLALMQDYAKLTGGKCIIHSARGDGTKITATFPIAGFGVESLGKGSPLE